MTQAQTLPLRVLGRDLRVGDTIEVWWQPGRDTITSLYPYKGPLFFHWQYEGGARVAKFGINKTGMTIEPQVWFTVVARTDNTP